MTTYKCVHGHVFDENEMVRIRVPEGEYTRDRFICPTCGTDEFDEAHVCEGCGEWFTADELEDDFCEKCREEMDKEAVAFSRQYQGKRREYMRRRWDEGEGMFA